MNFSRILSLAAAVAALAAAAMVCLVAGAFALYALLDVRLGPAGSAAVVSAVFALLALIIAVALSRKAKGKPALSPAPDESLITRAMLMAKERPFVAASLGAVAAAILIRNPAIVSTLITAAIAGRATKSDH